jgi:hypothetical protein
MPRDNFFLVFSGGGRLKSKLRRLTYILVLLFIAMIVRVVGGVEPNTPTTFFSFHPQKIELCIQSTKFL